MVKTSLCLYKFISLTGLNICIQYPTCVIFTENPIRWQTYFLYNVFHFQIWAFPQYIVLPTTCRKTQLCQEIKGDTVRNRLHLILKILQFKDHITAKFIFCYPCQGSYSNDTKTQSSRFCLFRIFISRPAYCIRTK